jgi:hypothetical protein
MITMEDGYVITVLGAGASVGCGYPLADDFFACVKAFGESVSEKCPRLSQVIDYVVAKAEELDCLTPDDLALQMYQTRFGENRDEAINVLYYARIVTDAFFLATERQVSASAVRAYKDYWHEVLGNYSQTWRSGFPNTKHRLVTFNYDRLAELAFVRHFPEIANNGLDLYGPRMLNTGFSGWRSALKFEDGFCYLKLHGSVGVTPIGRNEVAAAFGDRFMHYAAALPNTKLEITDDLYFEAGGDGLPKRKLTPLVAFPIDKQHVESGGEEYNFKDYIDAVGTKAREIFRKAARIEIIGYSFRAPDKKWLVSLLQGAPEARKLVINPHAKRICEELEHRDGVTNLVPLERCWGE